MIKGKYMRITPHGNNKWSNCSNLYMYVFVCMTNSHCILSQERSRWWIHNGGFKFVCRRSPATYYMRKYSHFSADILFLCCYKPGTNSFQLLQNLKANMLAVVGMTKGKKGSESHTQLSKERESGKNTKKMLNEKTSFFTTLEHILQEQHAFIASIYNE